MKKFLLVSFCILSLSGFSQSLAIRFAESSKTGDANSTNEIISYIQIENVSSKSIDVKVKRIDKNYTALTDSNAICWGGTCFSTSISVSPTQQTLGAGQASGPADFSGHVYPDGDGVSRSGDITYVFYDASNPSDSLSYTVSYQVVTNFGVGDFNTEKLLKLYPNPASDRINIAYNLPSGQPGTFELVNVVGNRVYQRQLKEINGEFKLDISKLARGVYFYMLREEGKAVLTRKLVVQ